MIKYRLSTPHTDSPGWTSQIFRLSFVCVHKGNVLDECWKAATTLQETPYLQALILSHPTHGLRLAGLVEVCADSSKKKITPWREIFENIVREGKAIAMCIKHNFHFPH